MSFSKATVKRFNEVKESNGPAPGQYQIQGKEKPVGTIKFQYCSERFKSSESLKSDGAADSKEFVVPTALPSSSSKRKLNFSSKAKSAEKSRHGSASSSSHSKEKEALELEIRKLLRQSNERERELNQTKEEVQRLQSKVAALNKDKLSLESHSATLEKSLASLQRTNDIMEAKISKEKSTKAVEEELKETTATLQKCKQKYDDKRVQFVNLEADLQVAKSRVSALEQANKILDDFNKDVEAHNNNVSEQVTRLQEITDKLRYENGSLQERLDASVNMLEQFQNVIQDKLNATLLNCMGEWEEKSKLADEATLQLQDRINNASSNVEKLTHFLAEIQNERNRLNQNNSVLQEKIASLEEESDVFVKEKIRLSSEAEDQEKDLTLSKAEVADLKERLYSLQNEFDNATSVQSQQIDQLTSECSQLKQDLEKEKQNNNDLSCEVDRLVADNSKHETEVDCVTRESEALKVSLQQREVENASLKNECEDLNDELSKTKSENTAQVQKNEEFLNEINKFNEDLLKTREQLDTSENRCNSLEASLEQVNMKMDDQEAAMEKMEQEIENTTSQHEAKLSEFTRRILETQKKLNLRDTELKATKAELCGALKKVEEDSKKDEEIERLKIAKQNVETEFAEISAELQKVKLELNENQTDELIKELEKWKCSFEELQEKVQPFETQINAYSAEKDFLLSETSAAQAEVSQLGRKYADLLGHQNHKQKIKHIVKLKEQNIELKEENHKLRLQVSSLQKQVVTHRKPRFDPSQAFQHHKENADPNPTS